MGFMLRGTCFSQKVTRLGIGTHTPTTNPRLFKVGRRVTTTSWQLVTMVMNPHVASPPSDNTDKVQRLSNVYKHPTELQSGEQGILLAPAPQPFDPSTWAELQFLSDTWVLHQAYADWYVNGGGKEAEKELLKTFNKLTVNTPLYAYSAARFQRVIRQAVEQERDGEDDSLMQKCKQAIAAHGKYDVEAFVELQRLITDIDGALYKSPSTALIRAAAERQLNSILILDQLGVLGA